MTPVAPVFRAYTHKVWNKVFGIVHLKPEGSIKGNVLLSYITEPFTYAPWEKFPTFHTNYWECHEIARQFLVRGYAVDVINTTNDTFIPRKKYDFFVDADANIERLTPLLGPACKKILHITICHWMINNTAEYDRISHIWKNRGIVLMPRRQYRTTRAIEYADCATVLGNKFTQDTYAYAKKQLYQIPLSTTTRFAFPERNYSEAKNSFIWMGGGGAALKGLDVTLEAFAKMPDKKLFICGGVSSERDFEKAFWKELYETPNISYLGRVDVAGEQFKKLAQSCAFVVYPSTSEGQSGAIIQAMHAGLVPLISYETGVDVHDFGTILPENSVEAVIAEVQKLSSLPDEKVASMARATWEFVNKHHTRESFSAAYEAFLTDVLKIAPPSKK